LNKIATKLTEISGNHASQILVTLARAYICGRGEDKNKYLLRFSRKLITSTHEATGVEKQQKIVPSKDVLQPRNGEAWGAFVEGIYSKKATLSFYSDEACINSITFKSSESAWLISDIGEGCD
jgi:hypothetical protein